MNLKQAPNWNNCCFWQLQFPRRDHWWAVHNLKSFCAFLNPWSHPCWHFHCLIEWWKCSSIFSPAWFCHVCLGRFLFSCCTTGTFFWSLLFSYRFMNPSHTTCSGSIQVVCNLNGFCYALSNAGSCYKPSLFGYSSLLPTYLHSSKTFALFQNLYSIGFIFGICRGKNVSLRLCLYSLFLPWNLPQCFCTVMDFSCFRLEPILIC